MCCKKYCIVALLFLTGITCLFSCNNAPKNNNTSPDQKIVIPGPRTTPDADSGYTPLDRSPMDMSYFPVDYPMQKMNGIDTFPPLARIIYSRPQKNGREVFGETEKSLCQYGKEWRLGANEATEIEFFKTATINNKTIPAGRYLLYCIPYKDKWIMVFNSSLFSWGLHIDATKDLFRIELPVTIVSRPVEIFTMQFQSSGKSAVLVMAWDNVQVHMPVNF